MDVESYMTAAAFLVAMIAFGVGWIKRGEPVSASPPPLPGEVGSGISAWNLNRVPCGFFRRWDLIPAGFLVGIYMMPLFLTAMGWTEPGKVEIGMQTLWGTIVMQCFMTAVIVGIVLPRRKVSDWLGLSWRGWPWIFVLAPLGWLLTNFFALGLQAVGFQDWLSDAMGGEGMQEIVEAFTQEDDLGVLLLLCVTAVIVAPLTEEVLFRGYLYGVAKRFCGRHAAVIFSSLIFAAIHHNAMALLPLCFLAVFLALAYEWTGSIWAPIGIHLVFNASTVAVQFALRFGWLSLPEV